MSFSLFDDPSAKWEHATKREKEKMRDKASKGWWSNPENRWENQDRTPLSVVQDALDWELYSDYHYDDD